MKSRARNLRGAFIGLFVLCSAGNSYAAPRSQLQRDVEGYAVAACLEQQQSDYLKNQGDGWGSVIVNRGYSPVENWHDLIAVVESEIRKTEVPTIRGDGAIGELLPVPIFFCSEIIDNPAVNAEIRRTMEKMRPDYKGR